MAERVFGRVDVSMRILGQSCPRYDRTIIASLQNSKYAGCIVRFSCDYPDDVLRFSVMATSRLCSDTPEFVAGVKQWLQEVAPGIVANVVGYNLVN